MTGRHDRAEIPRPRAVSRREFIIQLAALAGLLAGCSPSDQPSATRASSPTATGAVVPTAVSAAGPTPASAATPTPRPVPPRPEIVRFYPDVPSRVVHARHAGVWDGEDLVPGAIRQMLDASITKLTGLNDAGEAWAALFKPHERIAIKVNTIDTSLFWTHVPLVLVVAECLQEAGVPAEQIVVYDRYDHELRNAGYVLNRDGPGVRCYGTGSVSPKYVKNWTLMGHTIGFSNILLNCDALINMPILKKHTNAGLTFAMKNHYGTFDRPSWFHNNRGRAIAELNALTPIRDRARLIIGDALTVCMGDRVKIVTGDSLLMSFDPVAHDAIGLQVLGEMLVSDGRSPKAAETLASRWLTNGAGLGLGTNDLANMELMEVSLS